MNINNKYKIFHNIFSASYLIKRGVKNIVSELGLSEAEARFLFFIGLGEGRRRISDLIAFSGKHKSTVRQKLRLLEKMDLIKINNCLDDKREKEITFTKKGDNFFEKILHINNNYQNKIFKNFSKEEIKQLLYLLEKLNIYEK